MIWIAHYSDGTDFPQFNKDETENRYADIDRARLTSFSLTNGPLQAFELHLQPGQTLIFRRRIQHRIGAEPFTVYVVGWRRVDTGEQSLCFVTENGEVNVAGSPREGHPWFYPVELLPEEEG
jgi:hypothetical protein